jgi:hypothetical protein
MGVALVMRGIGSRIRTLSYKNREELRRVGNAGGGVAVVYLYVCLAGGEVGEAVGVERQCLLKKIITGILEYRSR